MKGHKIRHLKEKISKLDRSSPIVEAVLSRFCLDSNPEDDFLDQVELMDEFDKEYPPMMEVRDSENQFLSQPMKKYVCNSFGKMLQIKIADKTRGQSYCTFYTYGQWKIKC